MLRALPGLLVGLVSLLVAAWVLQLWRADLSIPFVYGGDETIYQALVKGMMETGWFLHNPALGAPDGLDFRDFPQTDSLHFLLIKVLAMLTQNAISAYNLYYVLTFPLTAIISFVVLRRLDISALPAASMAVLYACLPYHFFRGTLHLFLGAYYCVPLMVMVILWVGSEAPPFFQDGKLMGLRAIGRSRRSIATILIALVLASGVVYYSFFACILLLVAGIHGSLTRRTRTQIVSACIVCGLLVSGTLLNLAPNLAKRLESGPNPMATVRSSSDADHYGLRIAQLVLPVTGHRLTTLAKLKERYNKRPLINENDTATLGLVGACGLLLLLWRLLFRYGRRSLAGPAPPGRGKPWDLVATLTGAALFVGTIGAFGSIFALLVSDKIRSYNRISVYVAFFAFFAIASLLDRWWRALRGRGARVATGIAIVTITAVGVLDQTTTPFVPAYERVREAYVRDAAFVRKIEAAVPAGSIVFQLPHMPFPEHPPIHRMGCYQQLRGYLHSIRLRWSDGGMKGRAQDLWLSAIQERPPAELAMALALSGFAGISVDRFGYADNGASLVGRLRRTLERDPLESPDRRLAFFPLAQLKKQLTSRLSPRDLAFQKTSARHAWMVRAVEVDQRTPHIVGVVEKGPMGLRVRARAGQRGFVIYGPYWKLPPARYRVTFLVETKGPSASRGADVDIIRTDRRAFTEKNSPIRPVIVKKVAVASNHAHPVVVAFDAPPSKHDELYEFRVWSSGAGDVSVRRILLEQTAPPP